MIGITGRGSPNNTVHYNLVFSRVIYHLSSVISFTLSTSFHPYHSLPLSLLSLLFPTLSALSHSLHFFPQVGCCKSCGYGCGDGFPNYAWKV